MQIVLRQDGSQNNPVLARAYGPNHLTAGQVAVIGRDGDRTTFIVLLAQGGEYGCDGLNEFHFKGFNIEEPNPEVPVNWKFHPGTRSLGFDDPLQGKPHFFPDFPITLSGMSYLEGSLPAIYSPAEGVVPSGFEIFMRGLRIPRYELANGYLEESELVCNGNLAWHGIDVLRQIGKFPLTRFQRWGQSWMDYAARCDIPIDWDRGPDHGGLGQIPRFFGNIPFGASIGHEAAFQTILDASPGVYVQDVNGGLRVLPDPNRDPVHIFDSYNIVQGGSSVVMTLKEPDELYNFFIFTFRDLDDVVPETGQLRYKERFVEIDLSKMRDDNEGKLVQFGPFPLGAGPMYQSQAERMAWHAVRNLTALNAEPNMVNDPIYPHHFQVKGQMDSLHVAKSDNCEISNHGMVGAKTPLCRIAEEITHGRRGERTFAAQLTVKDIYRDTDHTPIKS